MSLLEAQWQGMRVTFEVAYMFEYDQVLYKKIDNAEPGGCIGSSSNRSMDFFLCWQ